MSNNRLNVAARAAAVGAYAPARCGAASRASISSANANTLSTRRTISFSTTDDTDFTDFFLSSSALSAESVVLLAEWHSRPPRRAAAGRRVVAGPADDIPPPPGRSQVRRSGTGAGSCCRHKPSSAGLLQQPGSADAGSPVLVVRVVLGRDLEKLRAFAGAGDADVTGPFPGLQVGRLEQRAVVLPDFS